ncbi:MAG: TetR/AcrR family transcriptional regulator [Alphaproteobacteria bacterium]|nr:TetR/AcrR family transcriptional regulator [Alphaproteobacteria bacterium SS10]
MSKRDDILAAAEALFDANGFHAVGVDAVIAKAGVSPRTLYRHFVSKTALVEAVLTSRDERFWAFYGRMTAEHQASHGDPVLAAVDAIGDWLAGETAQGCLFLKAIGEFGDAEPGIIEQARAHKEKLLADLCTRAAAHEKAAVDDAAAQVLGRQLFLLVEGAIAEARLFGANEATDYARAAAWALVQQPVIAPA